MSVVYDPEIEIQFKHTGSQAEGEEWISPSYTLPPDEVLEIFRIEVIPPVDTTTNLIKKLRYVTLYIEGNEYESLRINSIMAPLEHPSNVGIAVNLGVPYLHRPITGIIPTGIEGTCPKVARGQSLAVKTVADEAISQDYTIVLKAARVRGLSKLVEVVGTSVVDASFALDTDVFSKSVPVTLETFDELPGGLKQSKPQIFPWLTYARNKVATTPNVFYDFIYPDFAQHPFMTLSFNLVNKEVAYLVSALGVIPHTNSKALRLFVESRLTNPEYPIRPLPEKLFFYPPMFYDTTVNANLKRVGARRLLKPFLFHGVKGGIQIVDNGTSIPANGIEVLVYGVKFILK
jgi:hypothetical protein